MRCILLVIGRAGASSPSLTTGPRCLYVCMYLSVVRVPDTVNFYMSLHQSFLTKRYRIFSTSTMYHGTQILHTCTCTYVSLVPRPSRGRREGLVRTVRACA